MKHRFIDTLDHALPAGRYFVIDPCYVFGQDEEFWDRFCAFSCPQDRPFRDQFYVETDGKLWYVSSTAYGDGSYPVFEDRHVLGYAGVDAGCLAVMPSEFVPQKERQLGVEIELKSPSDPSAAPEDWNGDIHVGRYQVITSDEAEEECA